MKYALDVKICGKVIVVFSQAKQDDYSAEIQSVGIFMPGQNYSSWPERAKTSSYKLHN